MKNSNWLTELTDRSRKQKQKEQKEFLNALNFSLGHRPSTLVNKLTGLYGIIKHRYEKFASDGIIDQSELQIFLNSIIQFSKKSQDVLGVLGLEIDKNQAEIKKLGNLTGLIKSLDSEIYVVASRGCDKQILKYDMLSKKVEILSKKKIIKLHVLWLGKFANGGKKDTTTAVLVNILSIFIFPTTQIINFFIGYSKYSKYLKKKNREINYYIQRKNEEEERKEFFNKKIQDSKIDNDKIKSHSSSFNQDNFPKNTFNSKSENNEIIDRNLIKFEPANSEYLSLIYDLKIRIEAIAQDIRRASSDPVIKKLIENITDPKEMVMIDCKDAICFVNPLLGENPNKDAFAYYYLFTGKSFYKESLLSGTCKKESWALMKKNFKVQENPLNVLDILAKRNFPYIEKYISLLNQVAFVICKSDGVVTNKEQESLKKLRSITSSYLNDNTIIQKETNRSKKNLEDLLQELNSLIGLSNVKEEVISMVNFLKIQKERNKRGLKNIDLSLHCIFKGPPGTGKTTVARILSEIYFELGYLQESKLIETDRSGLVAQYIGRTAIKTNEIVDEAMNGVLFIDEAYMLYNDSGSDYGREAIGVLLKRMEDDRKNFAVVMAGYPKEMNDLISLNPGLESRINRHIIFEEFNVQELHEIFLLICHNSEYELQASANSSVLNYIEYLHKNRTESFGNARKMRNLFEEIIENQAMRLGSKSKLNSQDLVLLTIKDIPLLNQISN